MADESTDQLRELLAKVRAGDRDAAAKFALEYFPELRARVRYRIPHTIRREIDSEDAASSAARRLDEAIANGDVRNVTRESLQSFLASSALHSIQDKARSIRSRMRRERDRTAPAPEPEPERPQSSDSWRLLRDAPLSNEDRELLRMLGAGLEYKAIAAATGMTESNVRTRVSRARKHLETLIDDNEDTRP